MAPCRRGSVQTWFREDMTSWIQWWHGIMKTWLCEGIVPWRHDFMQAWLYVGMALYRHDFMNTWLHENMIPWIRDSVMMWLCEDLAPWRHGSMNIWLCEDIVLWRYGSMKTSWLCEDIACLSRLRTWVLISKTHTKLDGIGSIYNASRVDGERMVFTDFF